MCTCTRTGGLILIEIIPHAIDIISTRITIWKKNNDLDDTDTSRIAEAGWDSPLFLCMLVAFQYFSTDCAGFPRGKRRTAHGGNIIAPAERASNTPDQRTASINQPGRR